MKLHLFGASGRMGTEIRALMSANRDLSLHSDAPDCCVDFSVAEAVPQHIAFALEKRSPLLIGVTGLDTNSQKLIDDAARHIPIMHAPNCSMGANILIELCEKLRHLLPADCDVTIEDVHHRNKKDAPSGTALALKKALQHPRLHISSFRSGDIIGTHTVTVYLPSEQLEMTHRASCRAVFAHGALNAARFLIQQPSGRYSMKDLLHQALSTR